MDFFSVKTAGDLVRKGRQIVVIDGEATIENTLRILAKNEFQSCPVAIHGNAVGFVDVLDCLVFLVTAQRKQQEDEKAASEASGVSAATSAAWHALADGLDGFQDALAAPVRSAIDRSGRSEFFSIKESGSLQSLCNFIQTKEVPRLAVVNAERVMVNLVSASDVVYYFARYCNKLEPELAAVSVADIGFEKSVVAVPSTATALESFAALAAQRVHAVAVVDGGGRLVGTLSASDLRGVRHDALGVLRAPVAAFAAHSAPPHTVKASDTFEHVLLKMAATRVHRLFIVDEENKPTGVISVTDVVRFIDLRFYVKELAANEVNIEEGGKAEEVVTKVAEEEKE